MTASVLVGASVGQAGSSPAARPVPPTITAVAVSPGDGGGSSDGGSGGSSDGGGAGGGGRVGSCGEVRREGVFWDVATGELVAEGGPGTEEAVSVMCSSPEACPDGFTVASIGAGALCMGVVAFGAEVPTVTVDDLVPGVIDEARRAIPVPVLAVSPAPEAGGVVNVGLWLAIEAPAPVTARAEAGAVWAQVSAALESTTWVMGDGEAVACEGEGDRIVELDTVDASPVCGYVYRFPSAPQFTGTDDLVYHASVTARWALLLTASDGRSVGLDPVDVVFEFEYPVREVQTVGGP